MRKRHLSHATAQAGRSSPGGQGQPQAPAPTQPLRCFGRRATQCDDHPRASPNSRQSWVCQPRIGQPAIVSGEGDLGGGITIVLWGLLALFTTWAVGIPPFQLLALTFGVAFAARFALLARRGRAALMKLRQPLRPWLLGVGGLFGYHAFYFLALAKAPAVDASLIAYLWPLLIVLFSALLPGERLRWFHLAGALLGLLGAGLLVTKGAKLAFDQRYTLGYLAALACALIWSGYSVANRRFGSVPTEAVTGICGAVALLGAAAHVSFESSVAPGALQWLAIFCLGLGPVGLAFFVWDYGVKRGNIQVLGALAYGARLLSTLCLIIFGQAEATWRVAAACALIVGGGLLASRDLLRRA